MLPSLTQSGIKANTIVHYSRYIIIYTMMIPIMTSHVVCIQFKSNERRRNIEVFISGTCMQEYVNRTRTEHAMAKRKRKIGQPMIWKNITQSTLESHLSSWVNSECSRKGMQLLLDMLHLSCYSCYKRGDSITVNQFKCKEMLLIIIA